MNNKNADYGGVPVAASRQSLYQGFPIDFLVERNVWPRSGCVISADRIPLGFIVEAAIERSQR